VKMWRWLAGIRRETPGRDVARPRLSARLHRRDGWKRINEEIRERLLRMRAEEHFTYIPCLKHDAEGNLQALSDVESTDPIEAAWIEPRRA